MKIPLFLLLFLIPFFILQSRDNLRVPDIRTLGMGGGGGGHSSLFNPSLLSFKQKKELRLDYYNRYSLKDLASISASLVFPNQMLPMALHITSFGYDAYRESLIRLSMGKEINTHWALGIGFQYATVQSEIFETSPSYLSTDLGISYIFDEKKLITLSIINFPSILLNDQSAPNGSISQLLVACHMNWQFMNNVLITGGVVHRSDYPFSATLGMEYAAYKDFQLRTGIQTNPFQPSIGIGYQCMKVQIDIAMVYHTVLGISTGLGLSYSF